MTDPNDFFDFPASPVDTLISAPAQFYTPEGLINFWDRWTCEEKRLYMDLMGGPLLGGFFRILKPGSIAMPAQAMWDAATELDPPIDYWWPRTANQDGEIFLRWEKIGDPGAVVGFNFRKDLPEGWSFAAVENKTDWIMDDTVFFEVSFDSPYGPLPYTGLMVEGVLIDEQKLIDYIFRNCAGPGPAPIPTGAHTDFHYPEPDEQTIFRNWTAPPFNQRVPFQNYSFSYFPNILLRGRK